MNTVSHLSKTAQENLNLSDEERIEYILKDRWVGYERANEIIAKLEDLLVHPKIGRMPNMLIVGNTNNGKSRLVKHFVEKHPAIDNPSGSGIKVPVLYIEAPDNPNLSHFYSIILDRLFARHKYNDKVEVKQEQVIHILKQVDLGIIVIDEMNNLVAGSATQQRIFLNSIKYLGNQLQRPIVGVGTQDALRAIQTDEQLSNRFLPETLQRWSLNEQFLRLLASLERIIPLKHASNLTERAIATKLYAMCEGTIGELSMLINAAAIWSIRNPSPHKQESITIEALNSCGYSPPSTRKSAALKL